MDRSRGCTSLTNGQMEFMLQRRILKDDRRGVNEPLNSKERLRGSIWLFLDDPSQASTRRGAGLLISNQPLNAFSFKEPSVKLWQSGIELPPNVHLLNVRHIEKGLLVRLHHLFQKDEDPVYSKNAVVNLAEVLISHYYPFYLTEW